MASGDRILGRRQQWRRRRRGRQNAFLMRSIVAIAYGRTEKSASGTGIGNAANANVRKSKIENENVFHSQDAYRHVMEINSVLLFLLLQLLLFIQCPSAPRFPDRPIFCALDFGSKLSTKQTDTAKSTVSHTMKILHLTTLFLSLSRILFFVLSLVDAAVATAFFLLSVLCSLWRWLFARLSHSLRVRVVWLHFGVFCSFDTMLGRKSQPCPKSNGICWL